MKEVLHVVGYYPPAIGGIEYVFYGIVSNIVALPEYMRDGRNA